MPTSASAEVVPKDFYLFGYPIAHSASPALHNTIFRALDIPYKYSLSEAQTPTDGDVQKLIKSATFGGAAVTMPLKVSMMQYVDRLEPEAKEIGSINTLIVAEDGKLVGQNFDWEGIYTAFTARLPDAQRALERPFEKDTSAFIIGGGGTTRAAVYALSRLGATTIYLINRDSEETAQIVAQFPQYDLRPLEKVEEWTEELQEKTLLGVGAIPSFAPVTPQEKNVYALVDTIFAGKSSNPRYIVEMCYKPRRTPIFESAEAAGWVAIQGIEAMIGQGLAQQRAWLLQSASSPYDVAPAELDPVVEAKAREVVLAMEDIKDTK